MGGRGGRPVILGHSLLADNRRLVEVQRRCAYRGRAQHQAVSAGDASAAYLRQQGAAASQRVAEAGTVGIRAESCGALGLLGSPVQHAAQAEKSGGRGKERICRHHMCRRRRPKGTCGLQPQVVGTVVAAPAHVASGTERGDGDGGAAAADGCCAGSAGDDIHTAHEDTLRPLRRQRDAALGPRIHHRSGGKRQGLYP